VNEAPRSSSECPQTVPSFGNPTLPEPAPDGVRDEEVLRSILDCIYSKDEATDADVDSPVSDDGEDLIYRSQTWCVEDVQLEHFEGSHLVKVGIGNVGCTWLTQQQLRALSLALLEAAEALE
jgi:hypothetical protein